MEKNERYRSRDGGLLLLKACKYPARLKRQVWMLPQLSSGRSVLRVTAFGVSEVK